MNDYVPCLNCSRERIEVMLNISLGYRVECLDCGLAGPRGDTRQEAVRNWKRLYEDFTPRAGREPIPGRGRG